MGEYRSQRIIQKRTNELFIYEFEHGQELHRIIWVAWSPTGARTNEKDHYQTRETKATLSGLPSLPVRVVGMATTDRAVPQPAWEPSGPSSITLNLGESPTYIILAPPAYRNGD